jgi:hypothetical protein
LLKLLRIIQTPKRLFVAQTLQKTLDDYILRDYCRVHATNNHKGRQMTQTYLTTQELSERIKYDTRTIRERLKDSVLLEGVHYFRPFGGRKILYIWEAIQADMFNSMPSSLAIPMANGGVCHG